MVCSQLSGIGNRISHSLPAWRVDFNVGLSAFEPLIASLADFVELALRSQNSGGARLLFVSSVAVLRSKRSTYVNELEINHFAAIGLPQSIIVKEEPLPDPQVAAGLGYGESKWVSEQLLLEARAALGAKSTVVRVGQLSGDSRSGGWTTKEWLPNLIALSLRKDINALPSKDEVSDGSFTILYAC
jgi:thioester reductase-like protein